jgi:hypothetical protein
LVAFLHLYYRARSIVVGLQFDNENKILKISTINIISPYIIERGVTYIELSLGKKRLSDGITKPMYDCISLSHGNVLIGYFYNDNEM